MDIIETLTARKLPPRKGAPVAFVLHATGEPDLDKCLRFYTAPDGYQPHYLISTLGSVRRIVPDDRIAYHAGTKDAEARLYRLGYRAWSQWLWNNGNPRHVGQEFSGYLEWKTTWFGRGTESPLNLITRGSPNSTSIGVELLSPAEPTKDVFTDAQYASLAELLAEVGYRWGILLDRWHILGHYDVSPLRRCTPKGSYDPGRNFSWGRLWDGLRKLSPIT